jgi:GNAT superfamily N-acetyltransferase
VLIELRPTPLDHPDAAALIVLLQAHYLEIYGGRDDTPHAAAEFVPPRGYFVVGYVDDVAVACGGWRARDEDAPPLRPGDAEIKRMFVHPAQRGRGLARAVLADLEATAVRAGRLRMVLETGLGQPAAIGLYVSAGYSPMAPFGTYSDTETGRYYSRALPGALAPDGG